MEIIQHFAFGINLGDPDKLRNAAMAWYAIIGGMAALSISLGIYWLMRDQKKRSTKTDLNRNRISGTLAIIVGALLIIMILPTELGSRLGMRSFMFLLGLLALVVGIVDIALKKKLSYGNTILTFIGLAVIALVIKIFSIGI